MTIASCTKLVTSIAALQLLERGLITLSTDVAPILPELADLGVLMGFEEDGKPVVRERGNRITLRYLTFLSSSAILFSLSFTIP